MPVVNLPPGCKGLQMEDGTRYRAGREGGTVSVSDSHAMAIDRIPGNGTAGLVTGQFRGFTQGGVKNGRWCLTCQPARLWNSWNADCPKGHGPTVPETPADARSPQPA